MDAWAVTVGTARRGLGGLWPRPVCKEVMMPTTIIVILI